MSAASPISTPGLYIPSADDSWNLFDERFNKSIDISSLSDLTMDTFETGYPDYSQNGHQPAWNPDWSPGINAESTASSFLPLSMIYDPSVACDDEAADENETGTSSYQPSEIYETPQSPRKAAWGSPTHSRRTSSSPKADRQSTRSKRRNSSTASENGLTPKGHQLRSTKQGQRISYTESDVKNDSLKGARTSHNLVEKVSILELQFIFKVNCAYHSIAIPYQVERPILHSSQCLAARSRCIWDWWIWSSRHWGRKASQQSRSSRACQEAHWEPRKKQALTRMWQEDATGRCSTSQKRLGQNGWRCHALKSASCFFLTILLLDHADEVDIMAILAMPVSGHTYLWSHNDYCLLWYPSGNLKASFASVTIHEFPSAHVCRLLL